MADAEEVVAGASRANRGVPFAKVGLLLAVVAVAAAVWWLFGDTLTLASLAARESQLREWQRESPVLVSLAGFAIYVLVTGLSLPGAAVLTLLFGWYYGWLWGVVLVSFASTTGATVAFLLSRFVAGDLIRVWYLDRLAGFRDALLREGPFYLFMLRLIPAVPFFVINVVMGLTPLRTFTFWWVSQLGMLPATCVYVYAGASVPSLETIAAKGVGAVFTPTQLGRIVLALTLLGLFPLLVRWILTWFGRKGSPLQERAVAVPDAPQDSTR
jgi:uncharacterized membrane protein YdjX (TVP38/TMEM64 family)